MGKRVWIELAPLVASGPVDPMTGMVSVEPYTWTARLSCGHGKPHAVSVFASSGDPIWCDECDGTCLACGAPATTCVDNTIDWGEACETCAALPKKTWPARVEAHRFNIMSDEEHLDVAAHFAKVGMSYERKAADRKGKFWDEPRKSPLWWTHTRDGTAASAKEMFAKSAMHFIAAFVSERPAYAHDTRAIGACVVCQRIVTGSVPAVLVDNRRSGYGGRVAHLMCWEEKGAKWKA